MCQYDTLAGFRIPGRERSHPAIRRRGHNNRRRNRPCPPFARIDT